MNANKQFLATGYIFLMLTVSCAYMGTSVPKVTDGNFESMFRKDLAILSSDNFQGRHPASSGGEKTVKFLVESFKSMGLEPGNNGSYLQEVKLEVSMPTTESITIISSKGSTLELEPLIHILPNISGEANSLKFLNKELVFVGFGVLSAEYDWDDYAGVDVQDKIVVILREDPGIASGDTTIFNSGDGKMHNFFSTKYHLAESNGAVGAIIIIDSTLSSSNYSWEQRSGFFSLGSNFLDDGEIDTSANLFNALIDLDKGKELLKMAGYDYDSLLVAAYTHGFRALDLGLKLSGEYKKEIKRYSSYNVLALLPGKKRPDEIILYTAHWDHLGIDKKLEGDQIYNGAADNGTGIAAILNLARAFKALPDGTDRSILFIGFTAEEFGLLGSQYYGENPVFPFEKSVAAINIDMLKFIDQTNDIIVLGRGKSELDDFVANAAKKVGMHIIGDLYPEENFYYRSDNINLAKKGLPALALNMGIDSREHGKEWGMAYTEEFVKKYYHEVSDEYSDTLNVDGIMQYLQVTFDIGYTLANSNKFPNWSENDEFRSLRDEMMNPTATLNATP